MVSRLNPTPKINFSFCLIKETIIYVDTEILSAQIIEIEMKPNDDIICLEISITTFI